MKKILYIFTLGIIGLMMVTVSASAATEVSFSSTKVSAPVGQEFKLRIVLDPQGLKNYTAKMEVSYPSNLVEVESFEFAKQWISLPQPDYDVVDNQSGLLVKTGGYPKGVSVPVVFGTVTFFVKSVGSGVITVGDASFILNATNEDVLAPLPIKTIITTTKSTVPREFEFDIPSVIPKGFVFEEDLASGDRSIEVAYLQTCLRSQFGFYLGNVTGVFDDITERAVVQLQEVYSDKVLRPQDLFQGTGRLDKLTRRVLNKRCPTLFEAEETPPVLFDILVGPTIGPEGKEVPLTFVGVVLLAVVVGFAIYQRIRRIIIKEKIERLKK